MHCSRIQEHLSAFADGQLAPDAAETVRQHLESCAACLAELAGLQETLRQLDALPAETPSPRLRTEFYARLDAALVAAPCPTPTAAPWRERLRGFLGQLLPAHPLWQAGAAAALFALGLLAGAHLLTPAPAAPDPATQRELAALRQQVEAMGRLVAYSVAQQAPANTRLQQVVALRQRGTADVAAITQLLRTLALDPSTNVRLSALETLYAHADQPQVRAGVLAALPRENSPLVQLAMIDFLAALRDPAATPALENLTRDTDTAEPVRGAARLALTQL